MAEESGAGHGGPKVGGRGPQNWIERMTEVRNGICLSKGARYLLWGAYSYRMTEVTVGECHCMTEVRSVEVTEAIFLNKNRQSL
jgi:hypothetical protein